jgi:hypothetical protein
MCKCQLNKKIANCAHLKLEEHQRKIFYYTVELFTLVRKKINPQYKSVETV